MEGRRPAFFECDFSHLALPYSLALATFPGQLGFDSLELG
jgi:hypothetical protein